ncbi:MAG: hypothetical protein JST10_00875 [Bacteroidetes bacterium]|nr:hypothetical protein [Bacteroidota bacterium]MBS1631103.1 hypothetical protein [Bacteroidota bacterium]
MKQLPLYLLFLVFANCNNNSSSKQTTDNSKKRASTTGTVADNVSSGGCGSLIYFQKGAVIEAATYDATGKETGKQTTTVVDVKDEGAEKISDLKMDMNSSLGTSSLSTEYKCNGASVFLDMKSTMSNFAMMKNATVESSSLEFPVQLSVGENLPDATISIAMERGNIKTKTIATHTERKVEKAEKITTPAGSWNCFKVVSTVKTSMVMSGMNRSMPTQKIISWFAPDFGIVQTEMYSNDQLASRSYVISVKK